MIYKVVTAKGATLMEFEAFEDALFYNRTKPHASAVIRIADNEPMTLAKRRVA